MKVLNFGSVNIDHTYRVEHFVRPGETQLAFSVERNAGGKGFNQSIALARAGCNVYHAGHIGDDGVFLRDLCVAEGIDTSYLTEIDVPTGNAMIQVDNGGDNCIILFGGANQAIEENFITEVLDNFSEQDILVLQNEISHMNELIILAHQRKMKIALNPAPMNDNISVDAMSLSDWLILNETEAMELTGVSEYEEQLTKLHNQFPNTAILLTLGVRGAVYQDGDNIYKIGACKVKAVDTTAAGDTFIGFFLSALISRGSSPDEALRLATCASALSVMHKGAMQSIPTLDEVLSCGLVPEKFK